MSVLFLRPFMQACLCLTVFYLCVLGLCLGGSVYYALYHVSSQDNDKDNDKGRDKGIDIDISVDKDKDKDKTETKAKAKAFFLRVRDGVCI